MATCYASPNTTCSTAVWPTCGYSWLLQTPVVLLWGVWLMGGGRLLLYYQYAARGLHFNATTVHDPLAQGKAIALSQRKAPTTSRRRLQRYMKLGAMWAEWPSLSGRLPNNIRALTFSSAMYASLVVLAFIGASAPITDLYYALTPLPLLWLTVWRLNNRRALQFHIPDKSILGLLSDATSSTSRAVGTIAALYMDPSKLHPSDLAAVVNYIEKIAQGKDLYTRVYALRILWFLHLESFCKQRSVIGEMRREMTIFPELFVKDRDNIDRTSLPRRAGLSLDKAIKLGRRHTLRDAGQRISSSVTDLHGS
ncbi:hypothetical protein SPRG_21423, partial [Saprolegnia parasitica CBS 223.65]